MRKNERGGGERDPKEEISISGVTEVLGKQLPKNILTIPLQSCSLLYNTHVHAHGLSKKKKKETKRKEKQWGSYENYYFHIVDYRSDKSFSKTL